MSKNKNKNKNKDGHPHPFLDIEIARDRYRIKFIPENIKFLGFVKFQYELYQKQQEETQKKNQNPRSLISGCQQLITQSFEVKLNEKDIETKKLTKQGILQVLLILKLFQTYLPHCEYAEKLKKACSILKQQRKEFHSTSSKEIKEIVQKEEKLKETILNWLVLLEILPNKTTFSQFYSAVQFFDFEPILSILKYLNSLHRDQNKT
jgi:hypothetical protein